MEAYLGVAKIPLKIDFGFGDAITPGAIEDAYPTLLETSPAPHLQIYPRETVIAEKFEALVSLGLLNTRMKDFFDLWMLSQYFDFEGEILRQAISATFARRGTILPDTIPVALTDSFIQNPSKLSAWESFGRRSRVSPMPSLEEVAARILRFILPVVIATHEELPFNRQWSAGGDWSSPLP